VRIFLAPAIPNGVSGTFSGAGEGEDRPKRSPKADQVFNLQKKRWDVLIVGPAARLNEERWEFQEEIVAAARFLNRRFQ